MSAADFFRIYFNLFKACVGTGILTFPFLIYTHGILIAACLTFLSCLASMVSCFIFIHLISRKKCKTIECIPRQLKFSYNLVLVVKCFLTSLSYFQVIYTIIKSLTSHSTMPFSAVCLATGLVCSTKDKRIVSKISFVGVLGVVALFLGSLYLYFKLPQVVACQPPSESVLQNIGFFVFSFNCQHAIFSAMQSTKASAVRTRVYSGMALLSALIVYLSFGWLNCQFILKPSPNVLENWGSSNVVLYSIYPFYGLVIFGSLVLQMDPIAANFQSLVGLNVDSSLLYFSIVLLCYLTVLSERIKFAGIVTKLVSPFSTILGYVLPGLFLCVDARFTLPDFLKIGTVFIFATLSFVGSFMSSS